MKHPLRSSGGPRHRHRGGRLPGLAVVLLFLATTPAPATDPAGAAGATGTAAPVTPAVLPLAEKSVYRIEAFQLPVVEMELQLEPRPPAQLLVRGRAHTIGVGSLLYPIDNVYESLLDAASRRPLWWRKQIDQGDLQQEVRAVLHPERGEIDYGPAGIHPLVEGATWFLPLAATLHLQHWEPGEKRIEMVELEGRTLRAIVQATDEENLSILSHNIVCLAIQVTLEEPHPGRPDLFPRTDMLTYHLLDDHYTWRFWVSREAPPLLAAIELSKPGSHIRAELIRHERGGRVERRRRGGRRSHSRRSGGAQ